MARRWALLTRYTLRRKAVSIMKDFALIWWSMYALYSRHINNIFVRLSSIFKKASTPKRATYVLAMFRCGCSQGFTGRVCEHEINECRSNPCQNSARCLDSINSYECECKDGWKGSHCEWVKTKIKKSNALIEAFNLFIVTMTVTVPIQ